MVANAALRMLHEFLVAESLYEARGSEYRSRLKSLLAEMSSGKAAFPRYGPENSCTTDSKVLDDLVNYIGFIDCGDVREYNVKTCPGIHQYVYPEIPNFQELDQAFVKRWKEFFDLNEPEPRPWIAVDESGSQAARSDDSSSEGSDDSTDDSSSGDDNPHRGEYLDALITANDILHPRVRPGFLDTLKFPPPPEATSEENSRPAQAGKRDACDTDPSYKLPVCIGSRYIADKAYLNFGLMNNYQVGHEWACNRSYDSYVAQIRAHMSKEDLESSEIETATDIMEDTDDESEPYAQQYHKYDPKAIFGNYYCPLPKGYRRKLNISVSKKESDHAPSVTYNNFTSEAMEVTSTMYIGTDGAPRVSYVGTLAEKSEPNTSKTAVTENKWKYHIEHRLENALSGMFAIKNAISDQCNWCSGWSLNNGCSIIFCEYCEDRLINEFDPSVMDRLFRLRRHLTNELYSAIGYKFTDETAKESDKGDSGADFVTIAALCEVGGTYPKASLHDGRYVPNSMDLPIGAVMELSSIVYTNAELRPYSDCNSRILAQCRQRRQYKLDAYNYYLETLARLHQTAVSHPKYPMIVNEFKQVFKHGLVPFLNDSFEDDVQSFDELTSYVLYKLPMDPNMLGTCFYRRGIYSKKPDGPYSDGLVELLEQEGDQFDVSYRWHEMALKHSVRKHSNSEPPHKHATLSKPATPPRLTKFFELLRLTGLIDRMPSDLVERMERKGRLEVGFPTSLEMHILGIPDSVLDPSMYSKPGMAFLYSLPVMIQSLCAFAPFLKVAVASSEHKRRSKDAGTTKSSN